ncbi:MAG: hypothetical protein E7B11_13625 [Clostridiales bacterium]|nr:hypothetical protein [Clostridiales bacterium]
MTGMNFQTRSRLESREAKARCNRNRIIRRRERVKRKVDFETHLPKGS